MRSRPVDYPNASHTCIIDLVVDARGNCLLRNYRDTLYLEADGGLHRLDVPTHSPGSRG